MLHTVFPKSWRLAVFWLATLVLASCSCRYPGEGTCRTNSQEPLHLWKCTSLARRSGSVREALECTMWHSFAPWSLSASMRGMTMVVPHSLAPELRVHAPPSSVCPQRKKKRQSLLSPRLPSEFCVHPACHWTFLSQVLNWVSSLQILWTPVVWTCTVPPGGGRRFSPCFCLQNSKFKRTWSGSRPLLSPKRNSTGLFHSKCSVHSTEV